MHHLFSVSHVGSEQQFYLSYAVVYQLYTYVMPYLTFLPTPYFLEPRVHALPPPWSITSFSISFQASTFYLHSKPANWVRNSFQKQALLSIKAAGMRSQGRAASSLPCWAKKAFTLIAVAPFLHIAAALKQSSDSLRQK